MNRFVTIAMALTALSPLGHLPAAATEAGSSFILPGTKGPLAGATPPPGVFFANGLVYYRGDVGGDIDLPLGGSIAAGVDLEMVGEVPTLLWITNAELFGGRLGFGVSVPIIGARLGAFIDPSPIAFEDDLTTFADPVVTALLGWNAGNFHYQTGVNVNVPIGDYREGEPLNVSRNYWGADFYGAVTWLDPTKGLDLSSAVGITVNAENPATDYRSGSEFHWDWAAVQHFNEQFSAGAVGYYYQQITGDSGDGAELGDFKGRVLGIGAMVGFKFQAGAIPVSTDLRYYHEFAAENRLEGDVVFFNASMPLWVPRQ